MNACAVCDSTRDVEEVCVSLATRSEPAEYEYRCPAHIPKRKWTQQRRREAMADYGIDTWDDARGER